MAFLFGVIIFLVMDLVLLWYLAGSEYFSPQTISGDADVWNIGLFILLISIGAGLVLSLLVYLGEKVLYCGRREFPDTKRAIRLGIMSSVLMAGMIALHVFHFLNFFVALFLCSLVVIGIMIMK